MHVGAKGGQKRASEPLELDLQVVVSLLMLVLGTKLRSSVRQQVPLIISPALTQKF